MAQEKSKKKVVSATKKSGKQSGGTEMKEGSRTSARASEQAKSRLGAFPFTKENFVVIASGFLLIIIGYILMYGTENIFSFRQMGLPVIFILTGFAVKMYGIMGKFTFLGSPEQRQQKER